MPLKCLDPNHEIFAFNFQSDEAWDEFRALNKRHRHLRMHCCGAAVTPRTSKLGTRHFAHARVGACTTAPESAEHLLAKSVIAQAAQDAGWQVFTECSGIAESGESWIADVLVRKDGSRPVAFEVQWSRQLESDTSRRQARYDESGVRALWLFKQHDFPVDRAIPAFRLVYDSDVREFSVATPSSRLANWTTSRESGSPEYWQQQIPLRQFITGALGGSLKFAPAQDQIVPMQIWTTEKFCYKCGCETRIVNDLVFKISDKFPEHADVRVSIYDFDEIRGGADVLKRILPSDALRANNIGQVKPRFSGARQPSLSNGCAHCDALHGMFFDHEDLDTLAHTSSVPVLLDPTWTANMEHVHERLNRWWFDRGNLG